MLMILSRTIKLSEVEKGTGWQRMCGGLQNTEKTEWVNIAAITEFLG